MSKPHTVLLIRREGKKGTPLEPGFLQKLVDRFIEGGSTILEMEPSEFTPISEVEPPIWDEVATQ